MKSIKNKPFFFFFLRVFPVLVSKEKKITVQTIGTYMAIEKMKSCLKTGIIASFRVMRPLCGH